MFPKISAWLSGSAETTKDTIPTVISDDVHFLGNIVSDGVVDLNGTIEGNIRCGSLTVRQKGFVKGEISAASVAVYGKVDGLIRAKHVHLFAGCHIEGVVMHESITIEDGAFIDGKCKRTDKPLASPVSDFFEDEQAPSAGSELKILENIRLIR